MSNRKILDIIRRHTGENPKETGLWPHAEIEEMIAASQDIGFSAQARGDLLYVVNAFAGSDVHPVSDLTPEDKSALKKAALAGIETAEGFQALSPYNQASFVKSCVLLEATHQIGFTLVPVRPHSLPPAIIELTAKAYEQTLRTAGTGGYATTPTSSLTSAVRRNGETYCYVLNCAFEAEDGSGEWSLIAMLDASGRFFRSLWDGFDPNEPDS